MRRRALLAFAALAALATTVASCLSPTLPLPPPDHPDAITESPPGLWQVAGQCDVGAFVTVFNTTTGRGVVVEDRALAGTYHVAIAGKACDLIWVSQETVDGGGSPQTGFVLQEWSSGAPVDPASCP